MNKFPKKERLCSLVLFNKLLLNGKKIFVKPLKIIMLEHSTSDLPNIQVAISVPKKIFKSAVVRNLIKRRIREAFRINKIY